MPNIQVFSSSESAFLVNSFIIDTERGLVLVDTQFLTSSAQQLCSAIRLRSKPLLAIVITHPHPDHFNGLAELLRTWPGIAVYATQSTIDAIRATESAKRAAWTPVYGDDYPARTAIPNTVVASGHAIAVDGLQLIVDDLGEGESADITVIHLPQTNQLIASDLLYHRVHPWLAEGRTMRWLSQIEQVLARYSTAREVYPGHGPVASLGALRQQAEYLNVFRDWVKARVFDLNRPTAAEKASIVQGFSELYANYPLQMLIEMNVDGVAKELAAELA